MIKNKKSSNFRKLLPYWLLVLPGMIYMFIFNYVPMFGAMIAFKNYRVADGILGSKWVGFRNFKYFFESIDATRILRNTILYNIAFLIFWLELSCSKIFCCTLGNAYIVFC